jgi:hypothetical protein
MIRECGVQRLAAKREHVATEQSCRGLIGQAEPLVFFAGSLSLDWSDASPVAGDEWQYKHFAS